MKSSALKFILIGILIQLSLAQEDYPEEGEIRLQRLNGFKATQAGNVLIFHQGRWGSVCDDGWMLANAHVVCRSLGYSSALGFTKQAYFGEPLEEFWLDNVQCYGHESSLSECRNPGWGSHDCTLREAAGVLCSPTPLVKTTPGTTSQPSTAPDTPTRISHSTTVNRDRSGITTNAPVRNNVEYRVVTVPSYAAKIDTSTLAPHPTIQRKHQKSAYNTVSPRSRVFVSRRPQIERSNAPLVPLPTEKSDVSAESEIHPAIKHPPHRHSHREETHTDPPELPPEVEEEEPDELQNDAVVDAILTMEDNDVLENLVHEKKYDVHNPPKYTLTLKIGRTHREGYLHVSFDGHVGTVCSDGWDLREAGVVCRQLGLGHAADAVVFAAFGGTDLDKVLGGVVCEGHETHLTQCVHGQIVKVSCSMAQAVAGVICATALPDLVPNATLLQQSTYLQDRSLYYLQCALEEGCASSSAYTEKQNNPNWYHHSRRLLRFSSSTWNFGTADFRPTRRRENWEWHQCHLHYHSMEVFATYDLLDIHGNRVAEGHKASFCLEDVQCLPGRSRRYACIGFGEQGISVGCADDYIHDIDCQWIDVSDVAPGEYVFQVHVNPQFLVAELNYDNNVAQCDLTFTGSSVNVRNCVIVSDGFTGH